MVRETKEKGYYWSVGISDAVGANDDVERWLFLMRYRENFALKNSKSRNYEDSFGFGCTLSNDTIKGEINLVFGNPFGSPCNE